MLTKLRFAWCLQAQKYWSSSVLLSCCAVAYFKISRGTRIRGWFGSINAHAEHKRFELRRTGDSAEIQEFPTVVTVKWEVQTNEEAQETVHDLDLFVTLQLLEDTPAIISFGKLCEEDGYSYEWVIGHKTTVDQTGEENCLQNRQFHTSSFSRVVIQFWC